MDYRSIPKVELHVHLDGSIRPTTLAELANISLEQAKNESVAPDKCLDLNDYLARFSLPISVMQTKENLTRIAYELAFDMKNENVVYAEIRFAPMQHTSVLTPEEVIDAIIEGLKKVDIKINLLLCMMRNSDEETNKKVIDLACKYKNNYVVGIDLAGAEALYKTANFENLFMYAKKLGVNYTIHAGEADGPESILASIKFGATRIGHGVRILEDEQVLKLVRDKKILLEVCPTSNVQTNICHTINEHPIKQLIDNELLVCINTDNRTVSNTDLSLEYQKLALAFNFTKEDFIKFNMNAIDASFIEQEEKDKLKELIRNW